MPADPWFGNQQAFQHFIYAAVGAAGGVFGCLCAAAAGLRHDPFTARIVRCSVIAGAIVGLVLLEIALLARWGEQPAAIWRSLVFGGTMCMLLAVWLALWIRLVPWIDHQAASGRQDLPAHVVIVLAMMLGVVVTLLGLLMTSNPSLRAIYPCEVAEGLLLLLAGTALGAYLLHRSSP